jgi:hypothetical protein
MNLPRRTLLLAPAALALAGCASPKPNDYAAERPVLDLAAYFSGEVQGWGIVTGRGGEVVKRFHVRMDCRWTGDDGVLDEHFTYSDGSLQRRIWRIRRLGGGRYRGLADDVVGEAQGQAAGNALHWEYTLALPVDGRVWNVQMDDWMFLMNERVLLNRTAMRKFGITVAEVTISFLRPA